MPDYENDQDGPEETMGPSLMELMDGDPRLALPEGYGTELGDLMALNSGLSVDSMDDPMATDLPTTKPTTVTHSANPDPPTTPRKITIPNTGRPPSVPDFIAKLYR